MHTLNSGSTNIIPQEVAMGKIKINCTWDELDEILFGDGEDPVQEEIPEDTFKRIMEVANV